MNKRVFSFSISLLGMCSALLSSCGYNTVFKPYGNNVIDKDDYEEIAGENYLKPARYDNIKFLDIDNSNREEESFSSLTRYISKDNKIGGNFVMESLGEQKLLVVPVSFKDYPSSYLKNEKQSIVHVKNTFFGIDSVNRYYSVSSFYNHSSYGKLKISGDVLPSWFETSVNYSDLKGSSNTLLVDKIYKEVLSFVKENVKDISSYYVNNEERFGLPIYMVYDAPNDDNYSSALWAYTKTSDDCFYSWTSLNSLDISNQKYRPIGDAHVLIHETGHLLGLQDYYPEVGNYSPLGKADMMDYSIGDHGPFSKMLLNWTRPYHVFGSTTLSIAPFEENGDVIILNDNWNKTAIDEYIAIEYYTPTNLNSYDVKYGSTDGINEYKMMSKAGIRIYHVDARLGYYSIRTGVNCYLEEGIPTNASKVGIANSNHRLFRNNPLYQFLQKGGENTFSKGASASNDDLYFVNETFGVDTYINYRFHNGNSLGYTIKIKSLNADKAVIEITKF